MNNISRFILATLVVLGLAWSAPAGAQTIYVAVTGNDVTGNGTPSNPYASLAKAQSVIETSTCGTRTQSATVNIGQGTYYLLYSQTTPGTLVFTCKDSGTSTFGVTWQPNPANTSPVAVSGAIQVGGTAGTTGLGLTWIKTIGFTNLYQVTLPATYSNTLTNPTLTYNLQPFEYLYYQPSGSSTPTRRLRSRLEQSAGIGYYMSSGNCISTQTGLTVSTSLCNLGTYLRVSSVVLYNGTNCPNVSGQPNNNDGTKCLDRFVYTSSGPDQIGNFTNLNGAYTGSPNGTGFSGPCQATSGSTYPEGDVGLTLIDAWTVDGLRIACLDTTGQIIYFTGPAKGNSGVANFFGPQAGHRYYIENTRNAFVAAQAAGQTGLWFWNRSTSVLYYIANSGENPNTDTVLIPQLPYSSVIASSQQLSNQFPQILGSGAQSGDFVGGSLLWAKAPASGQTGLSYVTFTGLTFEMDDFVPLFTGFNNDENGEMPVPQAIACESCQHVTFNNDTVAYTSGSGILVASPPANKTTTAAATQDTVENSSFLDIGDSGIRIGRQIATSDLASYVVNNVTLSNNLIDGYSRVFADGEGVAEGNGQLITISHNDITDGYHAGISICNLGCGPFSGGAGVNGTSITSSYNHLWNMMQGVTSDGGSLYYNIGGGGGSGTGDLITNNLVHDTTDSVIIDGGFGYKGTGYGGEGIYLDAQSGGVTVENNVVFHISSHAAWMTEGPTISQAPNPNTFENNIFSLAIEGMFAEGQPWPSGCSTTTPFTTVKLLWNIWNFDLNETPSTPGGFFVVGGCTNSCGQKYYQFQDFEANAYYRANTSNTHYPLFCADSYAFHVLANQGTSGSCPGTWSQSQYDWLTFNSPAGGSATWQHGAPPSTPVVIDEDDGQDTTTVLGTCSWIPNFGTSGNPGDYILTSGPNSQFNTTQTNDTINLAGRSPRTTPPTVPETLPTYSYGNTSF